MKFHLTRFLLTVLSSPQENPDLFKWLTGQSDAPDEVVANPAFKVGPIVQIIDDVCIWKTACLTIFIFNATGIAEPSSSSIGPKQRCCNKGPGGVNLG